jgi:hypothetical protein
MSHMLSQSIVHTGALNCTQALVLSSRQPSHAVCVFASVPPKTQGPKHTPFTAHGRTYTAPQRNELYYTPGH